MVLAIFLPLTLGACAAMESLTYDPPKRAETRQAPSLRSVPAPVDRVSVAVYGFADQTGQRRRSERIADLSSAVTQGGAAMVVNALKDLAEGKFFQVVEREGVEHLLKERQIIRTTREAHGDKTPLPPLRFAGMIIEGGITAYESNTQQGGVGARALGMGASTEYRRDQVTVSLRAISVQTGEVVVALTTTKTIFSAQVGLNLFRYVADDKILEFDAGGAINEGPQVAVREAIERAVLELAAQGAELRIWPFAREEDRLAVAALSTRGKADFENVSDSKLDDLRHRNQTAPPPSNAPTPLPARTGATN